MDFLRGLHDKDCENSRARYLAVWAVLVLVYNDLGLLDWLDHWLLLHWEHATWLLNASRHVHRGHGSLIGLSIHKHLLLRGSEVILTLSCSSLIVISLVGTACITVDDRWLSKHLWVADLSGHERCLQFQKNYESGVYFT